jgi:hypothetical protein
MAGLSWRDAMAGCGARSEGAGWEWKRQSKFAQEAGAESSVFLVDWPIGTERRWFHILCDVARDRRGALLATLKRMGDTCEIIDGRIAFQKDDFGGLVLDDLGLPVAERVVIVEPPDKGKHRPDPDEVYAAQHPRRPLAPSSYGKVSEPPAPIPPPNALSDYLRATGKTTKEPTALRKDLEDRLRAAKANPSRPSAKPRPITVLGRPDPSAPEERISRPSDQSGLPTNADDAPRRVAPQPKPQPVDYSRRAPVVRIDAPGRG